MEFRAYASSSAGNLYSVESQGETLALECGLRLAEIREALRFSVARLAGCLVTHSHGDHSRAVGGLLRAGVDVYASTGTWSALGLGGHHRANAIEPLKEFRVGPFRVLPFESVHDAEGGLNFLIGAPDGDRLAFICDSAYAKYRFNGVTHWAIGVNFSKEILRSSNAPPEHKKRLLKNHMSLETAIALLLANDLRKTKEIHLLHLSDSHASETEFKRAVERATGRVVTVASKRGGTELD